MTSISMNRPYGLRLLLVGCSSLALSAPAAANDVIFSTSATQVKPGARTTQTAGVTQIKLASGGILSVAGDAEYMINDDGSIDLFKGSITVSGAARSAVEVRMPGAIAGRIFGSSSSSSFSVAEDGEVSGHTLTGVVRVSRNGRNRRPYREGQMWSAKGGENPKRTFANSAVEQPGDASGAAPAPAEVVAIGGDAGPVGAALNGIPVTLGDGLAAAGASSDIVAAGRRVEAAAANPALDRFPSGDLALLVAAAADLESAYGGVPFNAAQADIIRTYLGFLASGASGADFLTAYSNFTLGYLELIRSGGVPSGFDSGIAGASDIDAYLAFIGRTGAISTLGSQDRALADAYLAFLASGQDRDVFASSFTDLTAAYFAFLRSGGVPTEFTGASQEALSQSIAFLQQSGLLAQLNASDQALVTAFLNNGGIDFASQFQTALADYFAFLQSGQAPSDYTVLDQATLRSFLETLANTGLLTTTLGESASFYADYLEFLRAGGDVDAFAGLPANVFAGYRADLDAYFAFLEAGGIPSSYTPLSQDVIEEYVAALEAAGATQVFLGDLAPFYEAYFEFLSSGGNPDNFAQLPVPPDFPAFAAALNAYASFLSANGLPSDFTEQDLTDLQAFFTAVEQSGQVEELLGDNAQLLSAYFDFLESGGGVDAFAGLPVYLDYVAELNAYFEFLAAGNLPSEYTVLDAATIELYLAALADLQGGLAGVGDLNSFFADYFDFLLAGNDPDLFGGLPGMGGGMDGGSGGENPRLVYTGGFDSSNVNLAAFGPGITIRRDQTGVTADVASDGAVDAFNFAGQPFVVRGTASNVDISGDENVLIGRWTDGTFTSFVTGEAVDFTLGANDGFHYFVTAGFDSAATLPEGRVIYDVVAATSPTGSKGPLGGDGAIAPGTFQGQMAIIFDVANFDYQAAIDATISFDEFNVLLATAGGINGDGVDIDIRSRGQFNFFVDGVSNDDRSGRFQLVGNFSKEDYSQFGATYSGFVSDAFSNSTFIRGAAIFEAGAIGDDPADTGGSGGSGFTGTRDNQVYYTYLNGSLASGFGGSADFVNGEVTGFTSAIGTISSNDAQIVEATDLEQVAWARWTNGTVQSTGLLGNVDSVIGANGGYHVMTGEVTTSLPGGTIAYELIGGTSATDNNGSAPGSVTGDLAIAFGSTNRVGYDLTMALGGRSWAVSTTGGAANPGASEVNLVSGSAGFTFGGAFTNSAGTVTSTGDTCAPSCFVNVSGTLYGDNAAYAALAMNVTDTNSTGLVAASGLAIFGQEGSGASMTGAMRTTAQVAQSQALAATMNDWSRWSVPASATSDSLASVDPLASMGAQMSENPSTSVQPSSRAQAISQARQMLGGTVTWGDAIIR